MTAQVQREQPSLLIRSDSLTVLLNVGGYSCQKSEDGVLVIPREANLPIGPEARRVVARVSQAVVAVASIDGSAPLSPRRNKFLLVYAIAKSIVLYSRKSNQ